VARCPHLGLEEHGTTPFPFPSPSHHCYLTTPALPVGQREQQRYCLSKRYQDCPLYASHFPQETLVARVPETTPASLGLRADVESPLREPVEAVEAEEQTREPAAEKATGMRETEPSAPREPLAEEPVVARQGAGVTEAARDKATEVVTRQAAPEPRIEPASIEEVERPLHGEALIQQPPVAPAGDGVTGASEAWTEVPARARSPVSKTLLWTALGGAFLIFICVGGLAVVGVASSSLGIDPASLLHITPAPSALLVVSLASFLGAVPLLALLIWVLRQGPR
jgi:hypothetical protein